MSSVDLQWGIFMVDDKPYCIWDTDLSKVSLTYLESIEPSYFVYLADTHYAAVKEEENRTSQHAAIAIRSAFSHGLETLFALLFAAVQAPHCVPAWMNLYQNRDLRRLIGKVRHREPVMTLIDDERLTWSRISRVVHESLVLEDKELEQSIKIGFGQLWSRFAQTYTQEGFEREYNSIKHGLRVQQGGFSLAVGIQERRGVPAPAERMKLLGKSDFGASFLECDQIGDARHHRRYGRSSRNWDPEDMGWGLHAISLSVSNVVACLKIANGITPDDVEFQWPSDLKKFREPWKRSSSLGVTSLSRFGSTISTDLIEPFSKQEALARYREGKVLGVRRLAMGKSPQETPESPTT